MWRVFHVLIRKYEMLEKRLTRCKFLVYYLLDFKVYHKPQSLKVAKFHSI